MFRSLAISLPISILLLAATSGVLLAPSVAMAQPFDLAEPGEHSQALSGSMLWPSPVIRVCWESSAMSDEAARGWVQEAAEGTWEAVSNVDFVGWEACTEADTASVRVGRMDGVNRTWGLGTQLAGANSGMQLTFDAAFPSGCAPRPENTDLFNAQIREACIRLNAVHEFGHALGFAHEHLRDDAGEICEEGQENVGVATEPEVMFTPYDAESVMNYCASSSGTVNPALENGGVVLTAHDVAGVRLAYGPWDDGLFVAVHVEGYIEGQDNFFLGHERGEKDFDLSLNVGNGTLATATQAMCIDSGNLQVQVDLAISPFFPNLTLDADVSLFAGPGCGAAPIVDTETVSFPVGVGPNGTLAQWQEMFVSAGTPADWGHVRLAVYRGFDLEGALENCENCEELAANNAVPITTVGSTGIRGGGLPYIATPLACLSLRGCDEPERVQTLFPVREVIDNRLAPDYLEEAPFGGIDGPTPVRQMVPTAWLRHMPATEPAVATSVPLDEGETLGDEAAVADEPEPSAYPIVIVSGAQKVKLAGVGKVRRESAFAFRIGEGWWDAVEPSGRALGGGWRERGKKGGSLRLRLDSQFEATLKELISEGLDGAIDAAAVSLETPPKLQLKVRKDGTVAAKVVAAFEAEVDGEVRSGKYVAKLVGEVR
ncbi:MAG: M57 family metalloprotease [Myxococcota bacterium]